MQICSSLRKINLEEGLKKKKERHSPLVGLITI